MYFGDYYECRAKTERELLEVAQSLIAQSGAHALSFQKLADAVRIRKASVHYYFPTKSDLLVALLKDYSSGFRYGLRNRVDRCPTGATKLRQYISCFFPGSFDGETCPCGMLAAEIGTLNRRVTDLVARFFDDCARDLVKILQLGHDDGSLCFKDPPDQVAWMILSQIQGALLLSRLKDGAPFYIYARRTLESFIDAPGHEQQMAKEVEIVAAGDVSKPLAVKALSKLEEQPTAVESTPADVNASGCHC